MFELLKNSFQHAFDSRSLANYVEIAFGPTLDSDNNMLQYALRISDNGVGIPSGIDINQPETTGFAIIQTISDKVGGELKATAEEGTVIEFVFPDPDSRMHTPIHS
jgi:two-component sensor histidine kinase